MMLPMLMSGQTRRSIAPRPPPPAKPASPQNLKDSSGLNSRANTPAFPSDQSVPAHENAIEPSAGPNTPRESSCKSPPPVGIRRLENEKLPVAVALPYTGSTAGLSPI